MPWPLHGGPPIRIHHVVRVLSDLGHDVTLLAGTPDDAAVPHEVAAITARTVTYRTRDVPRLQRLAGSLLSSAPYPATAFATDDYENAVAQLVADGEWDLILVNFLFMLPAVLAAGPVAPVVLDQHESEIEIWQGYAEHGSLPERVFARLNLPKVRKLRREVLPRVAGVICVADEEVDELAGEVPASVRLMRAPNGVDKSFFAPRGPPLAERGPEIVFCAGMSVRRNVEAATSFATNVFPMIREEQPGAVFWVVGANPPAEVEALQQRPGVRVTGTVDDVRPYYDRARVAVIPNAVGGFSKLKLSEAFSMGLPVVASAGGAKGAPAGGDLVLEAGDGPAFADHVLRLLRDDALATDLGTRARAAAVDELSWDAIVADLERELAALSPSSGPAVTVPTSS